MELFPFQQEVVDEIMASPARRKLLVSPTGSGKTVIASELTKREPGRVLIFAHRRELVFHPRDTLAEFGIEAGVILAGEHPDELIRVQVASVQTLSRRHLPPANLVIVDEAHHCPAQSYRTILERYPTATIVGMTATPCRRDGRGLGSIFEQMIECPQVPELIELGFLVPTRVFAPSTPDLKGIRVRQGDFAEDELAARMDRPQLIGDICTHWHRHAGGRRSVVFASSVAHSLHIAEEFIKSGVRAEHIDGKTDKADRDAILARLSRGELDLVSNCQVLCEGWDQPDVSCIVLARPTKSMGLFRQMVGRGLRPWEGKDHCLVLDHAGAVYTHGLVEDVVDWTLSPDTRATNRKQEARAAPTATSRLLACSKCSAIRTAGKACPNCGHMPKPVGRYHDVIDGDLAEFDRKSGSKPPIFTPAERETFYRMLMFIVSDRGYARGWAAHKYKEKFGCWPPAYGDEDPLPPSPEVSSWVRSRNIAWAKSQKSRAA